MTSYLTAAPPTGKVDFPQELEQDVAVDGVHLVAEADVVEAADVLVHVPETSEDNDKSGLCLRLCSTF